MVSPSGRCAAALGNLASRSAAMAQSPDTRPARGARPHRARSCRGCQRRRSSAGRRERADANGGGEGNGLGGNGPGNGEGRGGSGNAPGQGGSILQGGVFSSPKAEGYNAQSSTAGSLVDVPNLDLPSSVDVIPEDLRRDQQALQIDDLLRDIGGAVKSGNQQYPDAFFLRGFEITSRDYRKNGFLDPSPTPRDFCNIERIEVLKGPASMLYGPGQPSGMIDLITEETARHPDVPRRRAVRQLQLAALHDRRHRPDRHGQVAAVSHQRRLRRRRQFPRFRLHGAGVRLAVGHLGDRPRYDVELGGRIFERPPPARHRPGRHQRPARHPAQQPFPRRAHRFPALHRLPPNADVHPQDQRRLVLESRRLFRLLRRPLLGDLSRGLRRRHGRPAGQRRLLPQPPEHRPLAGELPIAHRQRLRQVLQRRGDAQRCARHRAGLALRKRLPRRAVDSQRHGSDDLAGHRRGASDLRQSELRPAQSRHAVLVRFDLFREPPRRLSPGHDRLGRALESAHRHPLRPRRYEFRSRARHPGAVRRTGEDRSGLRSRLAAHRAGVSARARKAVVLRDVQRLVRSARRRSAADARAA